MNWYTPYLETYERPLEEVRPEIFEQIRSRMAALQSPTPLVTVSVIAYNEERHLLSCLWSLSDMKCPFPVEVIGVDNDSRDRTAEIFQRCGVPFYTEKQHSCGYARLCGLQHAHGKYHLNIDSDTMYPPHYVELMVRSLMQPGVVGVSSLWSYMPDAQHSRLALALYEGCRDLFLWAQHFKRPELSVRGLVFGYPTELGLRIGIRTDIIRGEDGSLALGLKQYGRIHFLRNRKARAVTGYGTVSADGSFFRSFWNRVVQRLGSLGSLFTRKEHYDDQESNLVKKK